MAISCSTKTTAWQNLDFGSFGLQTPPGWTKIEKDGIDSYFGGLTNQQDTLWFDYGDYAVDLNGEKGYSYQYMVDTVDGLFASIKIPDSIGKGYLSMYIPKVTKESKFTIWGSNIREPETVVKIYKSIAFKK